MTGLGVAGAAAVAAVCLLVGCGSLGYYAQSVGGHLGVMRAARPVADWIDDAGTPAELRERLALSQRMREFAVRELHLPDNASYRRYADLKRSAVVWNVVATPELSLQLETWCFAVMGCVGYRGYFDRADADALAAELRAKGLEAMVYGVPAYSTLGWTNWLGGDPLLNTFIGWTEGELARLLFHELAHQVVYAADDTMFNESFATAVERIGGARWLQQHGSDASREAYRALDARRRDFKALTLAVRTDLEAIYRSQADAATQRARKAERMARFRDDYARLKAERWAGFTGYDGWVERANNAAFAIQAAYDELVPGFERVFAREGGDFDRFYAEGKRLAALPKAERHATLRAP
ncbi:MAG: aminopeptidase [Burkholderiaceae bacterium]